MNLKYVLNIQVGDELFGSTVLETFQIYVTYAKHVKYIKYEGGGRLVWQHGAGEEQEVRGAGSRTGRRQVSQYHREKYCLEGEGKLKHFGNLKWTQSFIAEVLCFCNHSQ